jgi:hypothetical protein
MGNTSKRPAEEVRRMPTGLRGGNVKLRALAPHCSRGHLWSEHEAIDNKRGRRYCRECKRLSGCEQKLDRYAKREDLALVLDGLSHGLTLHQMTARPGARVWRLESAPVHRVMHPSILWAFMKSNPAIGRRMKAQSKENALGHTRAAAQNRRIIAAPALLRNNGADAYEAVQHACAHLWEGERGDVMSLMFVDVSEGRLKISDCAARVDEYRRRHNRRPRAWGDYSLDAPIGEDGSATWLDMVSVDAESGAWDINMMASTGRRK